MSDGHRYRRPVHITKPQAEYLRDLLVDDAEGTDLSAEERDQNQGILQRVEYVLTNWPDDALRTRRRSG